MKIYKIAKGVEVLPIYVQHASIAHLTEQQESEELFGKWVWFAKESRITTREWLLSEMAIFDSGDRHSSYGYIRLPADDDYIVGFQIAVWNLQEI